MKNLMIVLSALGLGTAGWAPADQVIMQNGDSYSGKVLSVSTNVLVLQNDNLGTVVLPRTKIATVSFGTAMALPPLETPSSVPATPQPGPSATNSISDPAALRGIRDQTNLIQMVQAQMLGSASPDAVQKYDEMLDGLSTGKIDLNDLRKQAQDAANQLRALKQEAGPDADGELDSYLAILDNFLQESAPAKAATNSIAPPPDK
jgi:hypothetical protein